MKIKHLFSCFLLVLIGAQAQAQDYKVTWDSTQNTFLMQQGAKTVPFDTAVVVTNLTKGRDNLATIETEIGLLERLVMLRRQAAQVREENRTLEDILGQVRSLAVLPRKTIQPLTNVKRP